jgi:tetratricopeptide (TPR) repeat protein
MPTIADTLEAAARSCDNGNLAEAERLYHEVLKIDPRQALAWQGLGLIARAQGNGAAAIEHLSRAVQLDRVQPTFYNNLGAVLQSQRRLTEAAACYVQAIALKGDYAEAHCNLGSAYKDQKRPSEAIACYTRALELNPELAEAHFNLGVLYQELGENHTDKAIACYQAAIRVRPTYAEAYNNLGAVYKRQDKLDEALACYTRALEFRPNFAEPLNNLGNIFHTQGRTADATVCYEQSLRINPSYAQAHYNRALANLGAGDFQAGWPEYEWRWQCHDFPKPKLDAPRWDGTPLDGRALLVHAEQGLGDTLQFIRYLPLVEHHLGRAVVQVQKPLVPLLEQSGFSGLFARGSPLPHYDVFVPLLSLPRVFQTTMETIPAQVPYLSADPRLVDQWRGRLGATGALRVGIAWQGSPTYRGDRFRSIPLVQFAPLAQDGIELISLQKGPGCEQLSGVAKQFAVRDFGVQLDSEHGAFMDTAAIMKCVDLVVASDSAVAHLAGALGVETWVALPLVPDWRWLAEREDSPWYRTLRLFRQRTFGNWPEVFTRIAEALRQKAIPRG